MNIKLIRLNIENFKGIKAFEPDFDGENAVIKGENGTGKTTVFDAFLWLLFGKDSTGRKDFSVRPLDANNQPIRNLVTLVEAVIVFGDATHTLKKESHENVVKGQIRGYETLTWINEVPKKVSEFQDWIINMIPENAFKLLTDPHYFNEKLHWKERRVALLEIAGKIEIPENFEELTGKLNGRTVDEYKKVLAEQKKRLTKDRDEISPRIDEIQKGLASYAQTDSTTIEANRASHSSKIDALDIARQNLLASEKQRQASIDKFNNLKAQLLSRQSELKNDTSSVKKYLDEKVKIEQDIAKLNQILNELLNNIAAENRKIDAYREDIASNLASLNKIREDYQNASEPIVDPKCTTCGQILPADKISQIEEKRKANFAEIVKRGNQKNEAIKASKQAIADCQAKVKALNEQVEQTKVHIKDANEYKVDKFAKIDEILKVRPDFDYTKDAAWQKINADMTATEKQIGKPASEQLTEIETKRKELSAELEVYNKALAQADQAKKAAIRIKELEAKETELAQQIADIDRLSAMIDQYKAAESAKIEAAVNGKFKHVNFKLFSELLNGGIEDACEATLNGVPYSDMSCGQKILVGIDIINVLSKHYELSVPLFIDNAESLTLPIEATSQVIQLFADSAYHKVEILKVKIAAENLFDEQSAKPVKKTSRKKELVNV